MMGIKYAILEDGICYDNDDYGVWGAVMYNLETKKVYTTSYGHGTDLKERAESIEISKAIEAGLVDEQELRHKLVGEGVFSKDLLYDMYNQLLCIPCTVSNRCRVIKGDCILMSIEKVYDAYRSRYKTCYKTCYNTIAHVYSPSLNRVANVSYSSITVDDAAWAEVSRRASEATVKEESLHSLIHFYAYGMSYASCDYDNKRYMIRRRLWRGFPYMAAPDIKDASNPQEDAKKAKAEAKKQAKMVVLREWAKSKLPEGSNEEIEALAEKVYYRYHA